MGLARFKASDGLSEIAINPAHLISAEENGPNTTVIRLTNTTHGITVKGTLANTLLVLDKAEHG